MRQAVYQTDFQTLLRQLQALLESETDWLANLANFSAVIYHGLPQLNWVGFYRLHDGELVLGPFQGKVACSRLKRGRGVCWAAAEAQKTVVVPDVHAFDGHIACDSASKSEIVVPVLIQGALWGVLDVDAPVVNRFRLDEREFLEKAVAVLIRTRSN